MRLPAVAIRQKHPACAGSLLFVEPARMGKKYDQFVFTWRAAFMQRLADVVRLGYHRWTSGEVLLERAPALVEKFAALYGVGASRGERLRLKRCGIGAARLLMYLPQRADGTRPAKLVWVLLVTAGDHPAGALETLRDARCAGERLRLRGYELLQLPRKDSSAPAWTWRMTADRYQKWRDGVLEAARKPWLHADRELLRRLYRVPGFAGIRSQVGHIVALWRKEWRRRRAKADPFPALPQLRYLQRLKNVGVSLQSLSRSTRGYG